MNHSVEDKILDKTTIEKIIAIAERLPTDGHPLRHIDVSDVVSRSQWYVCYEWFAGNAKRYVISGSNELTAISNASKDTLLEKLRLTCAEIEQAESDRELNNQVPADTLHNNKVTRKIAWLSLIVAIVALGISVILPCCTHSEASSTEQQCFRNDSTCLISASVLSEFEYVVSEPNRAKSLMLISDSSLSTRFICATLTSSKRIVAVSSSTLPLPK